jgi:hypothetical protein
MKQLHAHHFWERRPVLQEFFGPGNLTLASKIGVLLCSTSRMPGLSCNSGRKIASQFRRLFKVLLNSLNTGYMIPASAIPLKLRSRGLPASADQAQEAGAEANSVISATYLR